MYKTYHILGNNARVFYRNKKAAPRRSGRLVEEGEGENGGKRLRARSTPCKKTIAWIGKYVKNYFIDKMTISIYDKTTEDFMITTMTEDEKKAMITSYNINCQ